VDSDNSSLRSAIFFPLAMSQKITAKVNSAFYPLANLKKACRLSGKINQLCPLVPPGTCTHTCFGWQRPAINFSAASFFLLAHHPLHSPTSPIKPTPELLPSSCRAFAIPHLLCCSGPQPTGQPRWAADPTPRPRGSRGRWRRWRRSTSPPCATSRGRCRRRTSRASASGPSSGSSSPASSAPSSSPPSRNRTT
jgi:hypothetical protein